MNELQPPCAVQVANGTVSLPLSFGSFLAVLVVSVVYGTPGTNKSKTGHSRFKTGH
jgi:hypothetical protein